jgi:hypothetical protein
VARAALGAPPACACAWAARLAPTYGYLRATAPLSRAAVSAAGGEADADKRVELKSGYALPHDEDVGAVIVGFDRNINYYKIQYAQVALG